MPIEVEPSKENGNNRIKYSLSERPIADQILHLRLIYLLSNACEELDDMTATKLIVFVRVYTHISPNVTVHHCLPELLPSHEVAPLELKIS